MLIVGGFGMCVASAVAKVCRRIRKYMPPNIVKSDTDFQ